MDTIRLLFLTYEESLEPVRSLVLEQFPRRENEKDDAWARRIRSKYVDVCRFLLPAAALANVGMTANARVLESMIRKMLSHELMEVREIGEKVKEVARAETPTLVKYADAVPYLTETINEFSMTPPPSPLSEGDVLAGDWCTLVTYDQDGEQKVLAAALFRFGEMSYAEALAYVTALQEPERAKLAESLLGRLGRYDVPLRELEYSTYLFDWSWTRARMPSSSATA